MISLTASSPPNHRRAILLCADAAFFKYALCVIAQIHDSLPNLEADFCLVSEEALEVPASLQHLPIRLCQISVERGTLNFPVSDALPFATYLRLFAIEALATSYDRILYLDCDVFFRNGDLEALMDIQLRDDTCIAAVRDTPQQRDLMALPEEAARLGIPTFPYFNAGVLVIDPQRWTDANVLKRTLEVVSETPEALLLFDQSALNLALRGAWSELSQDWNFMMQQKHGLLATVCPPAIVHFIWATKPWAFKNAWVRAEYVDWYEGFLTQHFGEFAPAPPHPSLISPWHKALGASLRSIKWSWRYRRRFASRHETIDPWS